MPASRPVCVQMLMLLLAFSLGCQEAPEPPAPAETEPIARQTAALKSTSVRPLAPDAELHLGYWPFAPSAVDGTPGLTRVRTNATVSQAGCGSLSWQRHPIPQSKAEGTFCVGLLEGMAQPLLVVGRPGEAAEVLVPFVIEIKDDGEERVFAQHLPVLALPSITEAVKHWADQPGGAR